MATVKNYLNEMTFNVPVNTSIAEGLLVSLNSSGKAIVADRTTGPAAAIGFAVSAVTAAQVTANPSINVALCPIGVIECAAADIAGGAFTQGAVVYLDTAGKYTTTKPSTAADIIQAVGRAITTTKVAVIVPPYAPTLQAAATSTITA